MRKHFCSALMLSAVCALTLKYGDGPTPETDKKWDKLKEQYSIYKKTRIVYSEDELQSKDFGDLKFW